MRIAPNGFLLLSLAFGLQYGLENQPLVQLLLPALLLLLAQPFLLLLELDALLVQAGAEVHLVGRQALGRLQAREPVALDRFFLLFDDG